MCIGGPFRKLVQYFYPDVKYCELCKYVSFLLDVEAYISHIKKSTFSCSQKNIFTFNFW